MSQTSFHDIELLSAHLDGQLSQVDAARLEARLKSDPDLRAVYDDLRQSRAVLRKLPARRAPRNFTLTPKMAGVRPPLPRAFPVFRLASVLAAILFFFSYAINLSVPAVASIQAAGPQAGGRGGGGGGDGMPAASELVTPLTATPELAAPKFAPTQGASLAPQDGASPAATAQADMYAANNATSPAPPIPDQNFPNSQRVSTPLSLPVSSVWLWSLLGLTVLSGGIALLVRFRTEQKWNKTHAAKSSPPGMKDVLLIAVLIAVVLLLGASIYWMSTTIFYAPAPQALLYPPGDKGGPVGDKGSSNPAPAGDKGDKGNIPTPAAQEISLQPGLGYNFSAVDARGLITAIDFPADVFDEATVVHYIPGLNNTTPDHGTAFVAYAFTIFPSPKSATLKAPITITMDYGEDISSATDENQLLFYWWSGNDWQDAATTCEPVSVYTRLPDGNRLSLPVCQLGLFVLFAP